MPGAALCASGVPSESLSHDRSAAVALEWAAVEVAVESGTGWATAEQWQGHHSLIYWDYRKPSGMAWLNVHQDLLLCAGLLGLLSSTNPFLPLKNCQSEGRQALGLMQGQAEEGRPVFWELGDQGDPRDEQDSSCPWNLLSIWAWVWAVWSALGVQHLGLVQRRKGQSGRS